VEETPVGCDALDGTNRKFQKGRVFICTGGQLTSQLRIHHWTQQHEVTSIFDKSSQGRLKQLHLCIYFREKREVGYRLNFPLKEREIEW
jgi:hypothetical protein